MPESSSRGSRVCAAPDCDEPFEPPKRIFCSKRCRQRVHKRTQRSDPEFLRREQARIRELRAAGAEWAENDRQNKRVENLSTRAREQKAERNRARMWVGKTYLGTLRFTDKEVKHMTSSKEGEPSGETD